MASARTFLFTDIEGSTQRWEKTPEQMRADLAQHDLLMRQAITSAGGRVFKTVGDAFYAWFEDRAGALRAAVAVQRALGAASWAGKPLKVRVALHAGEAEERDGDFFGPTLNRVARLLSAGHGGQILCSSTAAQGAPAELSLRDLGMRRFKDLATPEHVFQVVAAGLPDRFPPLRSLDPRPNNIPTAPNRLIGREQELPRLAAMLERDDVRMVTLTGPGGTGKTRLAIAVASSCVDSFADGVTWVSLAPVRDPILVPAAIAAAFGLADAASNVTQRLAEHVRERQLLLVLDNFEQVTEGAETVASLLAAAPGVKVLVTSRTLLKIRGEEEFAVDPLALPAGELTTAQVREVASVRLFAERAQKAGALQLTEDNARVVAELCRVLDGLPLALELAAARVRLLPPERLLEHLKSDKGPLGWLTGGARDLPERQQTLRNAIAWSYGLLSAEEQRLFRALGAFVGGWTLEALEAVVPGPGTLDALQTLIEHSLVRRAGADRYSMLETLREYAAEELQRCGETDGVHRAHGDHFQRLATEAIRALGTGDGERGFQRIEDEYDNLRAVLRRAERSGDTRRLRELVWELTQFWMWRGHWNEGRRWAESALTLTPGASSPVADQAGCLAPAFHAAGEMRVLQGELVRGDADLREARRLFQENGDRGAELVVLHRLVYAQAYQGRFAEQRALAAEALALARAHGDSMAIAGALADFAFAAAENGELEVAEPNLRSAVESLRRGGEGPQLALVLNLLGELLRAMDKRDEARSAYEASYRISRRLRMVPMVAASASNLAALAYAEGRLADAGPLLHEALIHEYRLGNLRNLPGNVGLAGALFLRRGRVAEGIRLLAACDASLKRAGRVMNLPDRLASERLVEEAKQSLSAAEFGRLWASGDQLSLEDAVAISLRELEESPGAAPALASSA